MELEEDRIIGCERQGCEVWETTARQFPYLPPFWVRVESRMRQPDGMEHIHERIYCSVWCLKQSIQSYEEPMP